MPSFSSSGYGPYSSFVPAAADAYSALLQRMPAYAEEKFQRAKRKDDLDVEERNLAMKERKKRSQVERGAIREAKVERERGRKDAASADYAARQERLRGDLAAADSGTRLAARYGGDANAGRSAINQRRMAGR